MVNHVFQALEGEAGGDVVPAVVQSVDSVVLYAPVFHRQRVHACRRDTDFILPLPPSVSIIDLSGTHGRLHHPHGRKTHFGTREGGGSSAVLTSLSGALSHQEGADSVPGQAEQLLGLLPLHPLEQPTAEAQKKEIRITFDLFLSQLLSWNPCDSGSSYTYPW